MSDKHGGSGSRASWAPLIAACMAQFVLVVDTSMMSVAVPAIVRDLNTSVGAVQGAIALYPLVTGALMLTGGKIGSILGAKRAFIYASIVFGIGAVIAIFASGIGSLTFGWALIEGLGAAVLVPLCYVMIIQNYSGRQRVLGFGVLSGVGATASAIGPIIGGFFTTYLTWRLGFGLQVVGIIAAVLLTLRMAEGPKSKNQDIDWLGTLVSAFGFTIMTLAVILAPRYGWWDPRRPFVLGDITVNPLGLSPVPFMLGAGVVAFVLFLHWSQRRIDNGREPLLRPSLLKIRQFKLGITVEGIANMTFDGLMFMLPLFFITAVGLTSFQTGLALLPLSIAMLVVSLSISSLTDRISVKRLVQIGLVVLTIGLLYLWAVIDQGMTMSTPVVAFLLVGAGAGAVIALMSAITLGAVPKEESSEGSSVSRASMRIARSLGTAIIGSAFLSGTYGGVVDGVLRSTRVKVSPQERQQMIVDLEDAVSQQPDNFRELVQSLPGEAQEALLQIVNAATLNAARDTVLLAAAIIVFALLVSTFLKNAKAGDDGGAPADEAAQRDLEPASDVEVPTQA